MLVDFGQIRALTFGSQTATLDDASFDVESVIRGVIRAVERYINRPLEYGTYEQFGSEDHAQSVIVTPYERDSFTPEVKEFRGNTVIFDKAVSRFVYNGGYTKETLPEDIKQVIFRLVSYEYNQAVRNVYGITSKTVVTGQTNANITKEDNGVYPRELKKLMQYKNMNFYSSVALAPNEQD